MLSEKQHQHFDTFGFLVLPKVFTPEEIETLAAEFDRVAVPLLSGESASRGTICFDLLERSSHLEGLLGDERIAGIARNLLGPDAFCQQNTAQAHTGDEPWRSAFGWDVRIPTGRQDARENMEFAAHYSPGVRLTIELDEVAAGCRRVIAGSHREPYHDQLWTLRSEIVLAGQDPSLREGLNALCDRDEIQGERRTQLFEDPAANSFELAPDQVPHMGFLIEPGDLVIFDHMLWHGCFGSGPRRAIAVDWRKALPADHQKRGIIA